MRSDRRWADEADAEDRADGLVAGGKHYGQHRRCEVCDAGRPDVATAYGFDPRVVPGRLARPPDPEPVAPSEPHRRRLIRDPDTHLWRVRRADDP